MKYFKNVNTLEELRKEYRRLLKENHPDNGGLTEDAAEINAEYDRAFQELKNADTKENTWKYDTQKDDLFNFQTWWYHNNVWYRC